MLNTIKGAGVPCVEEIELNHHIVLEGDLLQKALSQVEATLAAIEKEAK